jgi:hypothetical protein
MNGAPVFEAFPLEGNVSRENVVCGGEFQQHD